MNSEPVHISRREAPVVILYLNWLGTSLLNLNTPLAGKFIMQLCLYP